MNSPEKSITPENDINFNDIRRFVELLTGDPNASVHWRFLPDSAQAKASNTGVNRTGTVDDVHDDLIDFQYSEFGIFVIINAGGHRDADITHVRALYIDEDESPLVKRQREGWHIDPDFLVIRDATHWHAYWRVDDCPVDHFPTVQKGLIAHYGSDKAVHNESRVMRVPGTFHFKDPANPTLVKMMVCRDTFDPVRSLDDLQTGLEDRTEARRLERKIEKPHSRKFIENALKTIDPGVGYADWRNIVAGIRSIDLTDGDEGDLHAMALAWSRGAYWPGAPPANYTGDDAVERVWDTMPPTKDGVGVGTLIHASGLKRSEIAFGEFRPEEGPPTQAPKKGLIKMRDDLTKEPKPTPLIPGLLMERETLFWYGQPKTGKTFAVLDLALSLATGLPVFGHKELQPKKIGAVLYLAGEGVPGLDERITAWETKYKTRARLFYWTRGVPLADGGPDSLIPYVEEARRVIGKPVLVVLDTMARSMLGLDENSSRDVTKFIDMMEGIKNGLDSAVVAIAHSGKDLTKGLRGSNAGMAGLDGAFRHALDEKTGLISVTGDGFRYTADRGPFHMLLDNSVLRWADKTMIAEAMSKSKRGRPSEGDPRMELMMIMEHYGFRGRDRMRTTAEMADAVTSYRHGEFQKLIQQSDIDNWYTKRDESLNWLKNGMKPGREKFQGLWRKTTRGGSSPQVFFFLPDAAEEGAIP